MWVRESVLYRRGILQLGGRTGGPVCGLSEQEFASWTPDHFDPYVFPPDWAMGSKSRQPDHIETWRLGAQNMSKLFAAAYGAGRLNERLLSVGDLPPYSRTAQIYHGIYPEFLGHVEPSADTGSKGERERTATSRERRETDIRTAKGHRRYY